MSTLSSLTSFQKRTVFKAAVDLIKADNRIHREEIVVLDKLQKELEISQEEIDMTHYITLSEAISSIKEMPAEQLEYILELFNGIMRIDSDISFKENLLLTSIIMSCSRETSEWIEVISVPSTEAKVSDDQIVYLEKENNPRVHAILGDKYDNLLITKAFGDIGFHFFYLPAVLDEIGRVNGADNKSDDRFGLLQKSIGYLTPYGNKTENVEAILAKLDTPTFYKVVLAGLQLNPDIFPFSSFMLVKIKESLVFDDNNRSREIVDFLCISMSDEIKKRILTFVSNFSEQTFLLPYDGYYKLLYDHLSSESKITSSILIDSEMQFRLENIDNSRINFESSPQARTLYLLLMRYGQNGISMNCFNEAAEYIQKLKPEDFEQDGTFSIESVKSHLKKTDTDWSKLIYNTISIYQTISTKDEQKSNYLAYISSILNHRSSLKTYINKGFSEIQGLAKQEQYNIILDKEFNTYRIDAGISLFYIEENGVRTPLNGSKLWKDLI